MNIPTYHKYLKESLGDTLYESLRRNVATNTNNNLVNLDIGVFMTQLKNVYPNGYEAWEEDFMGLINKKKGQRSI